MVVHLSSTRRPARARASYKTPRTLHISNTLLSFVLPVQTEIKSSKPRGQSMYISKGDNLVCMYVG